MEPVVWKNPRKGAAALVLQGVEISFDHVRDADERLRRFAPYIGKVFPETEGGIIESPLVQANEFACRLKEYSGRDFRGNLFLKCDNQLPVAGSIKARGGIHEVLVHAEELALREKILSSAENYSVLAEERFRRFFSEYKIAVGSTGNLGLSIGIMSAKLGFSVTVHMSRDAKAWKKDLLRSFDVRVIEYADDYSNAVKEGRKQSASDPRSYFVDDESSLRLFLGYAVAALRVQKQLEEMGTVVNEEHPLNVYLPCGVGGAPAGITFGLKYIFGDHVRCWFVEPVGAPCMLAALLEDRPVSVRRLGVTGSTEADGLAVGMASPLALRTMRSLMDGEYTLRDDNLFRLLEMLNLSEGIKIEPSAAAALAGPALVDMEKNGGTHIAWLTGGGLLPENEFETMAARGRRLLRGRE